MGDYMKSNAGNNAVVVLTARGFDTVLRDGGSQAWVLDAKRARTCQYVVCVQNHGFANDWGHVTAPHHAAFLVGRLKSVEPSQEEDCENRWILKFSEYAVIDIPNAWPGNRNPVYYAELESLGIDINRLEFRPMPTSSQEESPLKPLSLAEAKAGLALTFGVDVGAIEIVVRY